ncbi:MULTISPECIES: iron ABC transporter substrate-binding protein [Rhodomicrobium]|uniref:iron ABC transporter substrate-binding protein n=1 Tax=Rhodomicrobium TaxID=1068 RepID=UPI000B4AA410|nr:MULTISPECIES: iron ABC transporter substrate-binding protein [Rhodomicrobium]
MDRRAILRLCLSIIAAAALGAPPLSAQTQTRSVTDAGGRRVEIPASVGRVLAAGPPASILLYTLAPETMVGWVRAPRPPEKAFLSPAVRDLPEYGRLTGRGNTANLETVLSFKPDLIIDAGSTAPTFVSLADEVQSQTKIPYLLFDGALAATPATYRALGDALGLKDRAEELAHYAEDVLDGIKAKLAQVPAGERPRIYYGRGADGLETGLDGSINMEALEYVGAVNVAAEAGKGGLTKVSIEQVLGWNPDVILTLDPNFHAKVSTDPLWQSVRAVRAGRIYLAPNLPYGWFDAPPGVNRLIGIRWLAALLHPKLFPEDLKDITRDFYRRFYHVDLDEAQLATLLRGR